MTQREPGSGPHILTIALEDYYQLGAFNRLIQRGEWYRFESRLARNTRRGLDLVEGAGHRATFFVLGWVADTMPELVAEVAARGHEIASKGYYHRSVRGMTPSEFREDLARAREALQRASGQRVLGYRVADGWFAPEDLWALNVLAEEGYEYDSSIGPLGRQFASEPWRRFAHTHQFGERSLWEFPISAVELLGWMVPIAGGNWLRQLPPALVRRAVRHWHQTYTAPYVMYFHAWELDPDQPKISAAPWLQRVRTYRNIDQMPARLGYFFERYRFTSIAEHLGLAVQRPGVARATYHPVTIADQAVMAAAEKTVAWTGESPAHVGSGERLPLTVVIPCFNEELILPYLANTLRNVWIRLSDRYDLNWLFVDDASTDGTWESLGRIFGRRADCRLVRHERNLGVAGAMRTGLEHATTEIVASIDCDCTYDPLLLGEMVPLLTPETDLVVASPYHPQGAVRNVPEWRLVLSRTLSGMYRRVLHHKLATYTSCFRVYRRSIVRQITISDTRFLGVAELVGRLDLAGGHIVEFPTTLQVRMLGRSKMKILHTILGHLGLLARLAVARLRHTVPPLVRSGAPVSRRSGEVSRV